VDGTAMTRVFVFDSTHHALWAEQIALESGLAVQVIPAPAGADAKCDLALEALAEDTDALATVFREAGIAFRLAPETGSA